MHLHPRAPRAATPCTFAGAVRGAEPARAGLAAGAGRSRPRGSHARRPCRNQGRTTARHGNQGRTMARHGNQGPTMSKPRPNHGAPRNPRPATMAATGTMAQPCPNQGLSTAHNGWATARPRLGHWLGHWLGHGWATVGPRLGHGWATVGPRLGQGFAKLSVVTVARGGLIAALSSG